MKIHLGDFEMVYTDEGKGNPIVFIHGYPLNRQMWEAQLPGLADRYRILAPDLRGHGDSSATTGSYSMELLASDLARWLDRLAIHEAITVCGLSMGGYVSLAFCRLFPERLSRLVLAASRAAADTPEEMMKRDRASELVQKEGLEAIVNGMIMRLFAPETLNSRPELVNSVKKMMLRTSIEGVVGVLSGMKNRPDSTSFLSNIRVPTLVIHGEQDQIVPRQEAENMVNRVAGAKLVIIGKAGHLPNLEQPEDFNNALLTFLAETGQDE
jgi:3-oxoadipate enol-lactonase